MTLTMIHSNPARLKDGVFRVDRKFHVGMLEYAQNIRAPLLTVHPEIVGGQEAMDMIEVAEAELPYRVLTVHTGADGLPVESSRASLDRAIAASALVYGMGLGAERCARRHRVPYIQVHEYDLQTQVIASRSQVKSLLRKLVRTARVTWKYYKDVVPDARGAQALHCNGFPVYDGLESTNANRLLYLDSRMSAEQVIDERTLRDRLADRRKRRLKLLYSGRYEPLKGSVDAVKVALLALARGLDVEMHTYGAGSLGEEMRRLVREASAQERVFVHDAVTYPELVAISRSFDVFVCCHIQGDPSCTYVESFGSGLPIVGYGNRMWQRLADDSRAGFASPMHRPERVADELARLVQDDALLGELSIRARTYALDHVFEREFALRTDALNAALARVADADSRDGGSRADKEIRR